MFDLLSHFDPFALSALLLPLLISFVSGTLTPIACRRVVLPLLCWVGRGVRSLASRTATALRRKPAPELALIRETLDRLVQMHVERSTIAPPPGSLAFADTTTLEPDWALSVDAEPEPGPAEPLSHDSMLGESPASALDSGVNPFRLRRQR